MVVVGGGGATERLGRGQDRLAQAGAAGARPAPSQQGPARAPRRPSGVPWPAARRRSARPARLPAAAARDRTRAKKWRAMAEPGVGAGGGLTADVAAVGADAALAAARRAVMPPAADGCDAWFVLKCSLVMAAASGLGALPLLFNRGRALGDWLEGVAHALACGVMLAASFGLIHEGQDVGGGAGGGAAYASGVLTALGVALGAAFVRQCARFLEGTDAAGALVSGEQGGASAMRKTVLFLGVMTLHAFGEGSGVGVSFAGADGWRQGVGVAAAIGIHNIPEGAALALVLAARGVSARDALAWSTIAALPQVVVAVPAFVFASAIMHLLPLCMGFAAGTMIYLVISDMVPEAVEKAGAETIGVATVGSICAFEVFRVAVDAYYGSDAPGAAPVATPVHTSALVNALANASVGAATLLTLWAIARLQGASKRLLRNKSMDGRKLDV